MSQQIVEGLFFFGVVVPQQGLHGSGNVLQRGGDVAADLVGKALVIAHGKPFLAAVRGAVFQHGVELLNQAFGNGMIGCVDDQIKLSLTELYPFFAQSFPIAEACKFTIESRLLCVLCVFSKKVSL